MIERNVVFKDFRKKIRVALVYPNVYSVGMSNLGFQTLYRLFNDMENVYCERFFLDFENSLETGSRLSDFDLIAFSWQFELDALNILEILHRSGISLRRKDREKLVIAGGPCTVNPYPLRDFIDVFFIGEAEANLSQFMEVFSSHEGVEAFSEIEGLYVSKLDNSTTRAYLKNLDDYYPSSLVMSEKSAFRETFLLEIQRGCQGRCNFCITGFTTRPYRERSLKKLKEIIDEGIKVNGPEKISLIGPSVSDHSKITEILEFLSEKGLEVSVPSLRADALKKNIIEPLVKTGQRSITLAPESTERLRCLMNKNMSDEQFIDAVKIAFKAGIKNIKLYLIIGTPTETKEDIRELASFIRRLKSGTKGKIRLSINPLVPKPHTPYQWLDMEKSKTLKEKAKILKDARVPIDVKSFKEAFLQGTIALGDERLSGILEKAYFYGKGMGAFRRAFKEEKIAFDYFIRNKDLNTHLPWERIKVGPEKASLFRVFKNSFIGQESDM
ncbi:MAG: radical SAM protein [Candidatus Hydrothermarchaeaceae archaeon]